MNKMRKETITKIIAYDYLFNYFGGDRFKEKVITGAYIQLAIRVYKDAEEIKFQEGKEPEINGSYLCDVFRISFDREKIYTVTRNISRDNLFRLSYGWDKIEYEVLGYGLDYESSWTEEALKDMPGVMKNLPVSEPMDVTEEEFKKFLSEHIDDFDITDNINVQVPSVAYV